MMNGSRSPVVTHGFTAMALALCIPAFALANQSTAAVELHAEKPISAAGQLSGRIDQLIEPQARAGLFSGVILVQRGQRVVFQRAYGFASWELDVANDERTRFGIASITKPMTAAIVALLVAQHRLQPSDSVEKYIPGFPRGPQGGAPTIEQLLKHTAGVPHRVTTEVEETQPWDATAIVERVKARGLMFEPGSEESYSSAGYTCLARVVEIVEGRPFEDVLAERILRPARMTGATSESGLRLMPRRALPYILGAGSHGPAVERAPYASRPHRLRQEGTRGFLRPGAEELRHSGRPAGVAGLVRTQPGLRGFRGSASGPGRDLRDGDQSALRHELAAPRASS
jgi:CubicO group peptidase (beta-lactamase class C family)